MSATPSYQLICNGARATSKLREGQERHVLEWRNGQVNPRNMALQLSAFKTRQLLHVPDRVLDVLELASFVYCGDRHCNRGRRNELEFQNWSRNMHFVVKVRDIEFWNRPEVQNALSNALCWMTGDSSYKFTFQPGHHTEPAHLFDLKGAIDPPKDARIVLFSGGLDSLAGVVHTMESTDEKVCLVSHQSRPGTVRTQQTLFSALVRRYPGRVIPLPFTCTLSHTRASEETQRTRAFLCCSIALAASNALARSDFYIFENGITAINLPKRRDMVNARSSRTAHPKTLRLIESLFALVDEKSVAIKNPFVSLTKTDVFKLLGASPCSDLIDSSVSCSKTFISQANSTHCGCCTQCVDRRFAAYASESEQHDDSGIYALDIFQDPIDSGETKTVLLDFLRQAKQFTEDSIDRFDQRLLNDLVEVIEFDGEDNPLRITREVYDLCRRHGLQIRHALKRVNFLRNPFEEHVENSLFQLINRREHLRAPVQILVDRICEELCRFLPIAFQKNQPKDESDLNDKIQAYLSQQDEVFEREHPSIVFSTAKTKPDHSLPALDLWIETKYIRGGTSPSKATEGISADLTKYPDDMFRLFIVYDPNRSISDDSAYVRPFHERAICKVQIIR